MIRRIALNASLEIGDGSGIPNENGVLDLSLFSFSAISRDVVARGENFQIIVN